MKIELGKDYVTRSGRFFRPTKIKKGKFPVVGNVFTKDKDGNPVTDTACYTEDGRYYSNKNMTSDYDIVRER